MDDANRERLKEEITTMLAGGGTGIDLDSESRWAVRGLLDPVAFFR